VPLSSPIRAVALAAASALALSACSAAPGDSSPSPNPSLTVVAAFYPLAYVAERVGGADVSVTNLTTPGVEPHDLELSPAAVRTLSSADLVLYLNTFQAAVDDAVASTGATALDAAASVALVDQSQHSGTPDAKPTGVMDPHFWLDPTLLDAYASAVAREFSALDPEHAADYVANAKALSVDLTELDRANASGLATCERHEIFVSHEAFGYLADRYGLTEEGLAGIDPEAEPSPARLREIRSLMDASGATTIFTETLVSANVAKALAKDAGATTAVLNPLEGVAADEDYISVMRTNLDGLRTGLGCA